MFNIGDFLEKFKTFGLKEHEFKGICSEVFNQEFNIKFPAESFTYKNRILHVQASPAFKNTLFIKKEDIIKKLKLRTTLPIDDIR